MLPGAVGSKAMAMQMKVACPHCGKELKAPQELAGKRVACPSCTKSFRVTASGEASPEAPPAMVTPVPPPINRQGQAARFVAENVAETNLQLGADGRLPELQFEAPNEELEQEKPQATDSNPLLLIGALCFSITLSVILLVFEPAETTSNTAAKVQARREIQRNYIGTGPDLKPHEKRLREAMSAFHRSDHATERRLYREVLNMLKDESLRGAAGLTGPKTALRPPNDRHLEQQIATILSKD
jgi:hypothetical protein